MERVHIFDTTLRDGEQSPGFSMHRDEKLQLAHQLERLGVDIIEAGFPIASPGDLESVRAVAGEIKVSRVAALARAKREDVDAALRALEPAAKPRLHIFLATSDLHLKHKLRIVRAEALDQITSMIEHGKKHCEEVEFSAEDASRSDLGFLLDVVEAAAQSGATIINLPDTVGYAMPQEYHYMFRAARNHIAQNYPNVIFSAHCHNDLGMAVANALAAVAAGARQVECTINGIGERAGNASLEEIVMAMRVRPDRYPYETGVVGDQIFPSSQLLSEITGVPVQPNKAITGRNAFAHEAGIHQDGVLKNPLTYEIMTPQSVGVPDSKLVLGKHSGRHALSIRCEQLGYQFDRRALDDIYRRFVRLADKIKHVEDHHLLELIRDTHKPSGSATPLIEKIVPPQAAVVNAPAVEPASEPVKPFPVGPQTNAFGVPLPVHGDAHHEQTQQEDYLWGV